MEKSWFDETFDGFDGFDETFDETFAEAVKYTGNSAFQLDTTQNELIINSLNSHLISLDSLFKKEKAISILTDTAHVILSQKNPQISSKLSSKQKMILQQMDKMSFCITNVSGLNPIQKTDILSMLYDGDMQQCIDKIIHHVRDTKKNESTF